jgi:O-antigen/teichoic acid export membrane protein
VNVSDRSISRASAVGVLWNGLSFASSKLVVLITTVILARLLEPADFGLLAIGLVVIGYLDFVNDFGISAAVVQHDGDPEHTSNVAFWINMTLGVSMALAGYFSAPLIASFFDEPRAVDVVRVLSLSFPVTSIGAIHEARLRRALQFDRRFGPELAKGLVKGVVSITLALTGFGVWSLVWGQLAGALAAAIGYWIVTRWTPSFATSKQIARDLITFGSQLTLVGLLGGLHKNVDYLLVGRRLGSRQLGIYSIAFRLPQLLIESIVDIAGQVAFPTFARVRSDPDRLRAGLKKMLNLVGLIVVPLGVGLALTADPFIRVFYGNRWLDAIVVMQVLSVYMLVQSLSKTCGDVYKAMGRPGVLNKLALLKLAVTVPLLVIAVPEGIVAVAFAQLASAAILTIVRLILAARIVGVSKVEVFAPFVPSVRAAAAMVSVCLPLIHVLESVHPLVELLVVTIAGAAVYTGTLWVFDRDHIRSTAATFRRRDAAQGERPAKVISG